MLNKEVSRYIAAHKLLSDKDLHLVSLWRCR